MNTAHFDEVPGSNAILVTRTATTITNKPRRAVLAAIVLKQLQVIEKAVITMPAEEIYKLSAQISPHNQQQNGGNPILEVPAGEQVLPDPELAAAMDKGIS